MGMNITAQDMVREGVSSDVDFSLHLERPRGALRMYALEPPLSGQSDEGQF